MTIPVASVANTATFGSWLSRTNDIAAIISQNTVTVDTSSNGSISTGNGYVNGYFGANTLVAYTGIAGGALSAGNTLNLITNTAFTYSGSNLVSFNANSSFSNVVVTVNAVYIVPAGGNTTIGGNFLNVNVSTITVNSTTLNANSATATFGNTTVKANTTFNVFRVIGNNVASQIFANTSNTTIAGNVYFSNTLNVTGAVSISNTIAATGNATFSNTIAVTGNATFSNTISIDGAANVGGAINVVGAANVGGALGVVGAANVGGNLGVVGNANIAGNLGILGNLNVTGNLNFTGVSTGDFNPQTNVTYSLGNTSLYWLNAYISSLTLANTATIAGNATFSSRITVTGNATFSNTITVTGNATFSNTIAVTGNATFSNTLAVTGVATLSSNVSTSGTILINSIAHQFANTYTFTNSTVTANIDTVSASTYRSFEYTVQLSDSTITPVPYYHMTKLIVLHDGTTPYITEYQTLFNSVTLGTFDVIINGGNIALQLTPTTANVVAKFIRTSIVP
jgi:hypothetical protein